MAETSGPESTIAELPTWSIERLLEIGHEDDRDYALTPIGGFAVSPSGELYVSQPQDRQIRVFDATGKFLRAIGRRGEGPGEFLRLGEIGFLADTLWAVDNRRGPFLHFFSADGHPLRLHQIPSPHPYLGGERYYPLRDGGILMPTASEDDVLLREHEQLWLRWNASDSLVGTLPGYLSPAIPIISYTTTFAGRTIPNRTLVIPPLSTRSWQSLSPDHSSIVRADHEITPDIPEVTLRVTRYTPLGDTLATNTLSIARRPVPASAVDSMLSAEIARVASAMRSEEAARREVEKIFQKPNWYPPIRSVFVDSDIRTWLEVPNTAGTRWLLLDSDLSPTAWVTLPGRNRPVAAHGDVLWTIELSDLDVPRIIRYRIARAV